MGRRRHITFVIRYLNVLSPNMAPNIRPNADPFSSPFLAAPLHAVILCKCSPGGTKVPEGSGPARPWSQPYEDAIWMLVPVTEGTPWEERAARTLDKSTLI